MNYVTLVRSTFVRMATMVVALAALAASGTAQSPPPAPFISSPMTGIVYPSTSVFIGGTRDASVTSVEIFDGATSLGFATLGSGTFFGNWTLLDGVHTLTAVADDGLGNGTSTSNVVTLTVDTVAPVAPTITSSSPASPSNDATPVISGSAEANATIVVSNGVSNLGTTVANPSGAWSVTLSNLADGNYVLTATATDLGGNVSAASAGFAMTIDTVAPTAPAITSVTPPSPSSVATPTLTGTAEANSTVTVKDGGVSIGNTPVDGSGNWTFTTAPLTEGVHALTACATDAAGNVSSLSLFAGYLVDTIAPPAPTISGSTPSSPSNVTTPILSGTAEVSSTVTISEGANVLGTTTTSGAGTWTFTAPAFVDGTYSVTATATDGVGNVSTASSVFSLVIDTTAPAAPSIVSSTPASPTNVATPVLSGTSEAGAVITVGNGATTVATTTADNAGNWSATTSTLVDGTYSFTATSTDAAGNVSAPSSAFVVTIDTTAPAAPVIVASTPVSPTNVATPTLNGTAEASSTIVVSDGTSTVGTTTADNAGNWSVTLSAMTEGTYAFTATAADALGNVSVASSSFTFVIDTTAPNAPSVVASTPSSPTNVTTPTLNGTAEASSTIIVTDGLSTIATTTADNAGNWSVATSTLVDGTYSITATSTDAAGNVSVASAAFALTVDTVAPTAPVFVTSSPTSPTNATAQSFGGTAEAGITVTVSNGSGVVGTTTADGSGNWTVTTAMTDGSWTMSANAVDAAGNVSTSSNVVTYVVDTTAPNAPAITATSPTSPANTGTPTISGTSEAGASIVVYAGASAVAFAAADGAGNWNATTTNMVDGTYVMTATATDAAGNLSAPSTTFALVIDTTAPAVPTISSTNPVSPMNTVNPTAAGTAEAGSTVTVDDGFSTVGTTIADNAGNWTAVLTLSGEGQFTLRATSTDAAGNASLASGGLVIDVDTTAPVAPAIASSTPASPSNIANPVLSGTAEANSTVTVSDGTSTVGTTTASAGGAWTMTVVLADGSYSLVATATDAVNNVSVPSATFALVVDTTAPAAPVFVAATPASPSNSGTPVITGTAEANATVIVTDGVATIATTTADNAGNWSIAPTFAEGNYTLTATATDAASNVSTSSAAFTFVVDTTAPAAPVITASTPASPSNTGTPVIAGTAEANASVTVFDGTTTLAVTTADNSGNWVATVTLADGNYMLTATATDAASNVSPASSGFTVTVDATAPAAPVILASSPVSPMNVANPTISGTAEANSTVNVLDGATVVGSTTADNVGNWSVTSTFVDGTYALTATATDAASNVSSASVAFTIVIDTTAPAAPVFVAATPASPSNSGTPVITGTAEANATVVVSNGASVVATTTADNAGNWSVTPTFVDGTYGLTATATDAASNVSSASAAFTIVIDTVAPAAPVIVASNPVSPSTSATPVLSGTAEAGASVIVTDGTSTIGTVVADGSGNWNVTLNLVDGTYAITATATDAASNVSTSSNVFPLVVDTAAPAIPTITGSSPASPANTGTPVISGTADANTLIVVSNGVATVGSTTASASGTWSVTVTLADGSYTLTATSSDALGNASPASAGFTLVIDTTAPAAPVFVASTPASPSNSNSPVISGTCEPNATVNVFEGAVVIDTTFADNAGNWSSSVVFADGIHTLTATATDAASNVSSASAAFTLVVDTVAPAAPVIGTSTPTSPSNSGSPVIAGTAEANASVVVSDGVSVIATATADNSGNWSVTATLVDGTHSLTATATDAASNVSTASAAFTIVIDTTAPSVPNGVAASSPTTTAPVLSWTASSDVTTSVATYNVRRDDGTGPVVVGTTSNTTFTDGTLTLGGTYTYTVSAVDVVGNESAPSIGAVVVYAIPLPSNILTVGPTGNYPTIAAAVTAAANLPSSAHAVIKVASGTYGEFAINGAVLPSSTRILAEDGATVVVTPVATPVTVSNVAWTQSFEMVGVNVIATSFAATPVSVFANDGTVHFRDGNWSSTVGVPTVSVALSAQAAFANLVLSGNFNATSNNVISMTSVSGMTLVANSGTTVTGFGSTFVAVNSDATSSVTTWTGAACNLSVTPRFATQNQAVTIDLAAGASNAGQMWVLAVSASPILHWNYNPVSTGSPLILGASFIANANLAIVDTRVTNVSGADSLAVAGLNDPYYFGLPLVFQGVVLDATSSNFHVTTAATYVQLP